MTLSELKLAVDHNGYLLACHVWDWGSMPVLRGPEGGELLAIRVFRCASISSTYPCLSVRPLVGWSHFRISNLSASLVALREKLKREDPNYFSILGLGKIS